MGAWNPTGGDGSGPALPVTPANGGTGITSYTAGDLLYATGSTALGKLADVATGSVLVSGGVGVAPAWSAAPTVTSLTALASVNAAQTAALSARNTTAATLGAQQYSPGLALEGRGWSTGSSASQSAQWLVQNRPVQGNPVTQELVLWASVNGAAYGERLKVVDQGAAAATLIQTPGSLAIRADPTAPTVSSLSLTGGYGGLILSTDGGTQMLDVGATAANAITIRANKNLNAAAGSTALNLGSGTGAWTMPTGNGSWTGASNATLTLTAQGASGNVVITGGATSRVDGGTLNLGTTTATAVNVGRSGQTIGFFGATATSRYNTTGTTTGFTAGAGAAVLVDSTFTGNTGATAYTIGDVVRALKQYGLLTS